MLTGRFAAFAVRSNVVRTTPVAPLSMVRRYAQTASHSSVKPPVALYGIDGTYATALYTAAAKSSALEPTARALESLASILKKDSKLPTILAAPSLTASDKQSIVAELQKRAPGGGDVLKNFLNTLAENNRLSALEGVCDKFGQLMSAHRGEVEMIVVSASPLEGRVLKQLESAVAKSQYVSQGQKLKVVPKVDPDIRGGLVVEIGDRTIDLSVSSKMAKMNKLLREQL